MTMLEALETVRDLVQFARDDVQNEIDMTSDAGSGRLEDVHDEADIARIADLQVIADNAVEALKVLCAAHDVDLATVAPVGMAAVVNSEIDEDRTAS